MHQNKKIHFEISERKILLRIFDVFFVLIGLYLIGDISFNFVYFNFSVTNFYWIIVLAIYLNIIGTVFEMYNLQVASSQYQVIKSTVLTSCVTVLVYLLTPLYTPVLPSNRSQILLFFFSVFGSLLIWRMLYVHFLASNRFLKKVILICDKSQLEELVNGLERADAHYKITAFVNSEKTPDDTPSNIPEIAINGLQEYLNGHSVSEIVIASQRTDNITVNLYNQLIHLLEAGYTIREYTQVYENLTHRIPLQYMARDFYRYFPFSRSNQNHLYLLIVRLIEILMSLSGLLVSLVLLPVIFIGNAIGNRGKLFYTQERVGKNGEVFKIFKFRTMVKNAEANGAVFTTSKDTRITPFGKFLRKTRMDEFPQFINILKGDMGIIGPRPERPVFVSEIAELMPFYETRHVIKPGLTGWAQVNYAYGETIEDSLMKLQYDLYYIKHRSVFLDINITFKTLSTILFYRGQ